VQLLLPSTHAVVRHVAYSLPRNPVEVRIKTTLIKKYAFFNSLNGRRTNPEMTIRQFLTNPLSYILEKLVFGKGQGLMGNLGLGIRSRHQNSLEHRAYFSLKAITWKS
jgi:hypothetical protein